MSISQNSLRSSSLQRLGKTPGKVTGRVTRYERLMQVTLRHAYYNASDFDCPDFHIAPTAATKDLMGSIGLLFRFDGTGFSVLLDMLQKQNFINYLNAQLLESPPGSGFWRRLSFMLTATNPNFINITDMPICMSPSRETFYLCNTNAERHLNGHAVLDPGGLSTDMILPLTGSQYRIHVRGEDTRQIVAFDIAGNKALCEPVYWYRRDETKGSPQCPGPDPKEPGVERRDPVFLDFSSQPEDKYEIEECTNWPIGCKPTRGGEVVFAYSQNSPMCFIDLLFAQPPGVNTGIYPVTYEDDGDVKIRPAHYYLQFERRSTTWNYYIMSTGMPLSKLRIRTLSSPTPKPVTFTAPAAVRLVNGQPATLFTSEIPIPLQERSTCKLQLLGLVGGLEVNNDVLMNRLPVASSTQVIPSDSNFATHESKRPAACQGYVQKGNNYSDIYVYV